MVFSQALVHLPIMNFKIKNDKQILIRYIETNYKIKQLKYIEDKCWSNGNDLLNMGFIFSELTQPNCYIILKHKKIKIIETLEYLDNQKIYDCGNLVFTKTY